MGRPLRLAVPAAAVLAALLIGAPGAIRAQTPTLKANVGPGTEIWLQHGDGTPVTTLTPGTYQIDVTDQAASHNFHLTGPGVDQRTTVPETTTTSWTVTFTAGAYTYVCDPHSSFMRGAFTVAATPPPPAPPPPSPPPPAPPPPAPPPPAPPPPAPPPPSPPPSPPVITVPPPVNGRASTLQTRVIRSGKWRVLVVRLTMDGPAPVRFVLLKRGREVVSATRSLRPGPNVARIRLPRRLAAGTYRLRVLVGRAPQVQVLTRSIRLR